jgi:hypothetical protein
MFSACADRDATQSRYGLLMHVLRGIHGRHRWSRRLVDDGGVKLWSFPQANRHGTVWSPERGQAILIVDGGFPRRSEEIPHSLLLHPTGMDGKNAVALLAP